MIVSQNMTPDPVVAAPDLCVSAALQLMDECLIRHLPVVSQGRLVGVVSDRDLLGATAWRVVGSTTKHDKVVGDVMHREVVSISPDDQIVAALVEIVVGGVGCLPVLDDGNLVGIVTEVDLMGLYTQLCRNAPEDVNIDPPVSAIAHTSAVTVAPEATAADADDLCHHKGFRHLPVVREGELVGILSDRDLRRRAGAGLAADTPVEQIMSLLVQTIAPEAKLSSAVSTMLELRISALPVTWDEGLGILTSVDVLDFGMAVLRDVAST
jgi:CBS domain-containing protein